MLLSSTQVKVEIMRKINCARRFSEILNEFSTFANSEFHKILVHMLARKHVLRAEFAEVFELDEPNFKIDLYFLGFGTQFWDKTCIR